MWMPMDRMRNGSLTRDRLGGWRLETRLEQPAYNAVSLAVGYRQNLVHGIRSKRDQQPWLAVERKAVGEPPWIIDEAIERQRAPTIGAICWLLRLTVQIDHEGHLSPHEIGVFIIAV